MVEAINGGYNSTDSQNTNSNKRAIHIHGWMEHNLVWYAKCYSYGRTKISRSNEFAREIDHNKRDFSRH